MVPTPNGPEWAGAILVGSALGATANWLADWLPGHLGYGSRGRGPGRGWRWAGVWAASTVFALLVSVGPQGGSGPPLWLRGLALVYGTLLIAIAAIDSEHRRIPNKLLGVLALLALVVAGVRAQYTATLVGGLVGWSLLYGAARLRPGALGQGDVKLAGVLGLLLGYPDVFRALSIGIVAGGVAALVLVVARRATLKSTMAYAPYLVLGGLVALLQQLEALG